MTDLEKEMREKVAKCFYDELMEDNPDSEYYEDAIELFDTKQVITNVVALLTHTLQTYRDEIVSGVPKPMVYKNQKGHDELDRGRYFGFNEAIDEIKAYINSVSEKRGL